MKKIVLISCASKKNSKKSKAKDLYASALFRLNLKFAESLKPDKVFILSAKHGLLGLEEIIEPYNTILNKMKDNEVRAWSGKVLGSLEKVADLKKDKFMFLAGEKYRKYLIPKIANFEIPLQGLGIGKQLKWLREKTNG